MLLSFLCDVDLLECILDFTLHNQPNHIDTYNLCIYKYIHTCIFRQRVKQIMNILIYYDILIHSLFSMNKHPAKSSEKERTCWLARS